MVVKRLIEEKKRGEIFSNVEKYAKDVKSLAEKYFKDIRVFIFGSALRGDYNVMLSDIEIAIVTPCKEKRKFLKFKAEVAKNWDIFDCNVINFYIIYFIIVLFY
ncbi:MAG: nucleotidyltransferase domain-containing protein [Candidatus Calescibacterium sp.]|nr:nucleotidyltransferase domain-containing protein [Candidatus Calescibacterium sp.]MDW8133343.1 nucleotidyltransferase domain-containing protein [Candidatus Calescibacterium sp.]